MKTNNKKNILTVEDNLIIAMALERMITEFGHTAIKNVTTGKQALKTAINLKPDLILVDIILDGPMNGITAVENIKKEINVPIIFLTGNSDRHVLSKARETNFIDFLIKPVQKNHLKRSFNKAFSLNKSLSR